MFAGKGEEKNPNRLQKTEVEKVYVQVQKKTNFTRGKTKGRGAAHCYKDTVEVVQGRGREHTGEMRMIRPGRNTLPGRH